MKSSNKVMDKESNIHAKNGIDQTDISFFCNDLDNGSLKFWELDIAKTKLSKILNSSLDVICAVDANGYFLYVNAACESVWGYKADELIGKQLMDFVYPEDHEITRAEAARVMEGNNRIHFENRYVRKDGSLVPITWSARWDEKDKIRYGVARDATEKKKGEESEYIYKSLFKSSPFPIYLWDIETSQLIDCNEEALLKYKYSREEFLQLSINDLSTTKDLKIIDELIKTEGDGKIHTKTWTHKRKNGELMHIDVCGHLINYNGREAFLVIVNDVTKRIESEDLKEFDKVNTDALINSTEDLIWSVSCGFRLIVANKAFIKGIEDMTGITLKPGDDLLITKIFQEEQLVFWKECYSKALLGEPVKKEVYTNATKNWKESWTDISFNPIYKDQAVVGVACYSKDITKRKFAEEQLRKSEARLIEAQGVAKIGSWETDLLTLEVVWSQETYRIFEVKQDLFQSSHPDFINYVHPDDREKVDAAFANSFYNESVNTLEHRIITPGGLEKTVEESWQIFRDGDGQPIRAMGTCRDITERKKSEKNLEVSEKRYRQIVETAQEGIWLIDENDYTSFVNKKMCEIVGYSAEELIGKKIYHFMDDESRKNALYQIEKRKQGFNETHDSTFITKDGKHVWVSISTNPVVDEYGKYKGALAMITDITERKQAELQLKESNERYNLISQATNDMVWDWNILTGEVYRNKEGWRKILGEYENGLKNGIIDDWDRRIHPEDAERVKLTVREIKEAKKDFFEVECRVRRYDGTYAYIHDRGNIIRDEKGNAVRILGATQDITKRKEAETRLAKSEMRFKSLVQNSSDIVSILDDRAYYIYSSPVVKKLLGYEPEDMIGKNAFLFIHPDDVIRIKNFFKNRHTPGNLELSPYRYKNAQGEWRWLESKITDMSTNPEVMGYVFNSRDVTEKILLEEELERQKTLKQHEITEAVISAQEQERQEIGRELHDNINQILASSRLYLNMVEKVSIKDASFLEETDNLINTAINEIRSLSHSMIPPSLSESELVEALEDLIQKTSIPGGIAFNLVSENFDERNITDKHKLTIYRIVQEQFNNILKYASAKNVVVKLDQDKEKIILSIKDDGIGFDIESKSKGVGLLNIKTRASLFNGELFIISSPGNGCELKVVFEEQKHC